MGVPKRGKRKKDNQKQTKKKSDGNKKSNRKNNDESSNQDRGDDRNKYVDDEFKCLKELMNIKNLSHMPLIVGATVLENYEDVKRLIEAGYDPNEAGTDRNPPLIQAARYRCPDIIVLLIEAGADPKAVDSEHQDSVLMCAASSRKWDERSFIGTYERLKAVADRRVVDLSHTNQLGNSILHCIVKRHWPDTLHKLLSDGAPYDLPNGRGVTPLMMAAARSHVEETGFLVNAGAKVLQEDEKGCTSLCYVAVSLHQKRLKKKILDLLTNKFTTRRGALSWRAYIRRRLELLTSDGTLTHKAFHESASKIAIPLFAYICQNVPQGPEILLELNSFGRLADAISRQKTAAAAAAASTPTRQCSAATDYTVGLVGVTSQLLRCCPCCFGCGTTTVTADLMAECFIVSGAANACLNLLNRGAGGPPQHAVLVPIYFACAQDGRPQTWLRENYHIVSPYYLQHVDSCAVNIGESDEQHAQMTKQRLRKAKTRFLELKKELDVSKIDQELRCGAGESLELDFSSDKKYNSKKMRRKAKALKAKIDKIRRADILERANFNKSCQEQMAHEEEGLQEDEWNSVNTDRQNEQTKDSKSIRDDSSSCAELPDDEVGPFQKDSATDEDMHRINEQLEQLLRPVVFTDEAVKLSPSFGNDKKAILGAKIVRLQVLMSDLVDKYEAYWKRDRKLGYPDFVGICNDLQCGSDREEQIRKVGTLLPSIEQRYIAKLRENFHRVIEIAMGMFNEKNAAYETLLTKLEESLMRHNVRGERIYNDLPDENDPLIDWEAHGCCGVIGGHLARFKREECWPPDAPSESQTSSADDLYLKEISNLPPAPEPLITDEELDNVKRRTVENAYHLVQSFTRIVSDSDTNNLDCKDVEPHLRRFEPGDDVMVRAKAKFFTILNGDCPTGRAMMEPPAEGSGCCMQRSLSDIIGYDIKSYKETGKISRWEAVVRNLQNLLRGQHVKKGEIVMSVAEMRPHFIISSGGNFGDVELGIDRSGRPLAVKRIGAHNVLQSFIGHLLDIQHRHLLPYVMCDYTSIVRAGKAKDESAVEADGSKEVLPSELILVTPLCEYNLGEYLMCLKMNRELNVTSDHLVRQMLQGLKYLHSGGPNRPIIIHGNLKPSNVLIDLHGTVKVAEFGIFEALYQNFTPPKSSVIWFSRETYEKFTKQSSMECSTASDIQVAGMLVHFVLTGGLHPFGIITDDILENLCRGVPRLGVTGCELDDLISWMLVFESRDRPNIDQVLAHVYFWDAHKKWQFLLACAGITEDGKVILREIDQFHNNLNILALRNNIIGDWVSIVREKFPYAFPADVLQNDTPIGLLKFLRTCIELKGSENPHTPVFGFDLKSFFLASFPALPLSLYRLIENTEWLVHPAFVRFSHRSIVDK